MVRTGLSNRFRNSNFSWSLESQKQIFEETKIKWTPLPCVVHLKALWCFCLVVNCKTENCQNKLGDFKQQEFIPSEFKVQAQEQEPNKTLLPLQSQGSSLPLPDQVYRLMANLGAPSYHSITPTSASDSISSVSVSLSILQRIPALHMWWQRQRFYGQVILH